MAKRSKVKSAVSVRSKLEILEKRRLLSTTLPLGAPTILPDLGSLIDLSQPTTSGAGDSGSTPAAATDGNSTDSSLDLSIGLDAPIDALTSLPPTVAQLPIDPIAPIPFDDVGPQVDPVTTVVDLTTPIDPVQFVDPTATNDGNSTDPSTPVDTTTDTTVGTTIDTTVGTAIDTSGVDPTTVGTTGTAIDATIDPATTVDPIASIDPVTTIDGTVDTVIDVTSGLATSIDTDLTSTSVSDVTSTDAATTNASDLTPVTDPLASIDPSTAVDSTTIDSTTGATATDVPPTAPVVLDVPIVDQTDLGVATPVVQISTPDSGSGTTVSAVTTTVATTQTPVVSQPSQEQAIESDPPFMHVSLPPMIGGNQDGVSGMHPVYVPVASTVQTVTSDVSSTARAAAPAASADVESAHMQSHADVHENTVTGTATVATQAAFSAMLIPPVAQEAPAPAADADAIAAVVDHTIDVTGTRKDMTNQLAEEHLKLTRLVWTFPTIDNEPQVADASSAQPPAQTAGAKVAPVADADASTDGPAVIQLVQEVDVSPADAAGQSAAAQSGAAANAHVVHVPMVSASVANALNDPAGRTRNIVLAVVAGVASLAVQSYQSSRRKLAAAARAAHLDPLAAWLDDPEFDRRR